MKKYSVEFLERSKGLPVVQLSYRKFPGLIIQGDSLNILVSSISSIVSLLSKEKLHAYDVNGDDAYDLSEELGDSLSGLLELYVDALEKNNMEGQAFRRTLSNWELNKSTS